MNCPVWDHPRGCGEHWNKYDLVTDGLGSSPRMRGTLCYLLWYIPCARIIPADAGNTVCVIAGLPLSVDHPRGCGEHSGRQRIRAWNQGSSPRMRGTPCRRLGFLAGRRIIPADAGNTAYPFLCGVGW